VLKAAGLVLGIHNVTAPERRRESKGAEGRDRPAGAPGDGGAPGGPGPTQEVA